MVSLFSRLQPPSQVFNFLIPFLYYLQTHIMIGFQRPVGVPNPLCPSGKIFLPGQADVKEHNLHQYQQSRKQGYRGVLTAPRAPFAETAHPGTRRQALERIRCDCISHLQFPSYVAVSKPRPPLIGPSLRPQSERVCGAYPTGYRLSPSGSLLSE